LGKKAVSIIVLMLVLLTIGMLSLAFKVQPVKSTWTGTVYIRADGSIDPPDAPIQRNGDYYALTGNITSDGDGIVIERSNIIIDGAGHMIRGIRKYPSAGINLTGRTHIIIENINIQNFTSGIWLYNSSGNSINRNNITNNVDGIKFENSSNNTISGNNIVNNSEGIELNYALNNTIYENNIRAASPKDGVVVHVGVSLYSSLHNNVSANIVTNNHWGVFLYNSSNNIFNGNNITANDEYGIYLRTNSSNNKFYGNNIINSWYGVEVDSSNNNTISKNNIMNGQLGIYMHSSDANVALGNLITDNRNGIDVSYSSNNTILGNLITENEFGIVVRDSSSNNVIYGNNIINNTYAMQFWGLSTCPSSNIIYHNNFINNPIQTEIFIGYDNIWDDGYPSGGNYWSDYNGVDHYRGPYQNETGSDGIGDTPYIIDENNIDHYPLMGLFNSFNISVGISVDVASNSTIEDFKYFESNNTIVMYISNMTANQTAGFCRLTIPHDVISPPYTVKVNGTIVEYDIIYENYTSRLSIIYFTYEHSKLEITIIPEFPLTIILLTFLMLLTTPIIFTKKTPYKKNNKTPHF